MPRTIILLLLLLLLPSCGEERDPIASTVERMADAAEERDAAAVVKHLSSRYTDDKGGRAEAERTIKRYLFGYQAIDIAVQKLETHHSEASGTATFRVEFWGVPKKIGGLDQLLPRAASYRFQLGLVNESGEWKVSRAQWEREDKQPAF